MWFPSIADLTLGVAFVAAMLVVDWYLWRASFTAESRYYGKPAEGVDEQNAGFKKVA
jgi:hypothetical protein